MSSPLLGRGLGGLALLVISAFAATVPAVPPPRFLSQRSKHAVGKKATLLTRKALATGPGFFRSDGVRGGVQEEALGALGDSDGADNTLDRNWVRGASMSLDFRVLDNLEPIAPMDRLHAALGSDSESGHYMNPVFVPNYLNPDAFPTVVGKGCNCTMPEGKDGKIACSCGKNGAKAHYTWLKSTPVLGTNNYTLEPSDITYPNGDYWAPALRNNLVAPADALPPHRYPNQALANHIWPLPASAREDRIGVKYARYLDQVQDRSLECDTVSEKCTVPCKPGDEVIAVLGNVRLDAKVIKAFVGNAMQIEFKPSRGEEADTTPCPLQASCTAFRYCKSDDEKVCSSSLKDKDVHNWAGTLIRKHECPKGKKVCETVHQVVMASTLAKGGKACKAAA